MPVWPGKKKSFPDASRRTNGAHLTAATERKETGKGKRKKKYLRTFYCAIISLCLFGKK